MKITTIGMVTLPPVITGVLAYAGNVPLGLIGGIAVGAVISSYLEGKYPRKDSYHMVKEVLQRLSKGEEVQVPPELEDIKEYIIGLSAEGGSEMTPLLEDLQKVARGDLTGKIPPTSALLRIYNDVKKNWVEMLTGTKAVLEELRRELENVRDASSSIEMLEHTYDALNDLISRLETQSVKIAELNDHIQALSAAIEQISTQTQQVAEFTMESADAAEKGKEISDQAALKVEKINSVSREMEKAVSILSEYSERIGQIVDVITDIAEQTNLLALNAAIEAARAGEQGRGFAVVADSVRELAEQSRNSAKQIGNLIKEMQDSVSGVVKSIHENTKVTQEVGESIQHLIAAFDDIARRAHEIASMVSEISNGVDQQASAVQDLVNAVEEISSVNMELSETAKQVMEISNDAVSKVGFLKATFSHLLERFEEIGGMLSRIKV